jgi:hypothetical protein
MELHPPPPEVFTLIARTVTDDFSERLGHYALVKLQQRNWRGVWGGPPAGGVEAEDLAMDALNAVLTGRRAWDPAKHPDLLKFLYDVIDSNVSHLVRRSENVAERRPVPAEGESEADFLDRKSDKDALAATDEIISNDIERANEALFLALFEEVNDDPLLGRVLEALLEGVSGRAEVAEKLGVTPNEVTQAKKRLDRRLPAFRQKYAHMNPFKHP